MTNDINNRQDILDSRDIIERLEELEGERGDILNEIEEAESEDEQQSLLDSLRRNLKDWDHHHGEELTTLQKLNEQGSDYAPDWTYGETLIRDSYFEEYAQEFAEDIGAINRNASWPNNCIDWEQAARELQQDYTAIDFDGVTYWVR